MEDGSANVARDQYRHEKDRSMLAGTVPEVCGPAEVRCVPTYLPGRYSLFLTLSY